MPRTLAGAEDIPLHDREPARTSLNSNGPPLTPSEQPPPDYNTHDVSCTPPPYIDKKPKWWANRRLYISLAITGSIVILVTVLAKTLKVQVEKVAEKEYTWDMDNISQAKVYGLAATECEQGTFVVWKVKSGHYFWKGTLLKGDWNENSGEIPVMKVDQGDKIDYRREGFVNMTATCWESRFGLVHHFTPASGDTILIFTFEKQAFEFIYYDYHFRQFVQTTLDITYVTRGSGDASTDPIAPSVSSHVKLIDIVPYNVSSLALTRITAPADAPSSFQKNFFYLVPQNLDEPDGPANVVHTVNENATAWGPPELLNVTAVNSASGIAVANVDGGKGNQNATELHLVLVGQGGILTYMNWTERTNWSEPSLVFNQNDNEPFRAPSPPFTLCIPATNPRDSYWNELGDFEVFRNHTRLNLYSINKTSTSITYSSISYSPRKNQMRSGGRYSIREQTYASEFDTFASGIRNPGYIASAARKPIIPGGVSVAYSSPSNNTLDPYSEEGIESSTVIDLLRKEGEERRWSERVQLFYVEGHGIAKNGRILNDTSERPRELQTRKQMGRIFVEDVEIWANKTDW